MGIYKLIARGEFKIYKVPPNKTELIETRSNSILPLMGDVVARLLGNFIIGRVDQVGIYKSSLNLAMVPIINYTHPNTNQVEFSALFNEASFNGDFDELGLFSSNMGQVSKLIGTAGNKTDQEHLLITWTITII